MSVTLFVGGDVVNTLSDSSFIDEDLMTIIRKQDLSICNFEAPISTDNNASSKAGPSISQKEVTLSILKEAGFDLLLLANNHMFDFGQFGLRETILRAKEIGLLTVGAGMDFKQAYEPITVRIKGFKIAVINACESQYGALDENSFDTSPGYAWLNHREIDNSILKLRGQVDFIIVCAHAGLEHYQIPLLQWKKRYKELCDLGADCILGSHPHIPQGYEIYNGNPIFYSLGNFYFDTPQFRSARNETFSLVLRLSKKQIDFEIIYHGIQDGRVRLFDKNEVSFDMEELNRLISDERAIEAMYLDAYDNITSKMIASVYSSYLSNDTIKDRLKKTILKFVNTTKYKKRRALLLQHMLKNETYRWVTISAIDFKKKGYEQK